MTLAYYEAFGTKQEAMKREYAKNSSPEEEGELIAHGCNMDIFVASEKSALCHELIHHHIVAETAAHDKQVEDLMGPKYWCLELKIGSFNAYIIPPAV